MRVILRNPPLFVLLTAIVLNMPVRRRLQRIGEGEQGWASRRLARFIKWRDDLSRRAS